MNTETNIANSASGMPGVKGGWLTGRLSRRLDRMWLGGIVAVNALVWVAFGLKYVGLALLLYCFVFMAAFRRQIKAAYPAVPGVEYHIGYAFNWPSFNPRAMANYF